MTPEQQAARAEELRLLKEQQNALREERNEARRRIREERLYARRRGR